MSRPLLVAFVVVTLGCGGSDRAQPPASAYGPPMQPGQMQPGPPSYGPAPAPPPPPPPAQATTLASCAGTPFGAYGALAERDPANRRMCRNEPPIGPFTVSDGGGGTIVVRPANAPASVSCTATLAGCTVRATCDERQGNDFLRRADWEITFQGTRYTGLVKLLDNVDKGSLPCSSRVLVSGNALR